MIWIVTGLHPIPCQATHLVERLTWFKKLVQGRGKGVRETKRYAKDEAEEKDEDDDEEEQKSKEKR